MFLLHSSSTHNIFYESHYRSIYVYNVESPDLTYAYSMQTISEVEKILNRLASYFSENCFDDATMALQKLYENYDTIHLLA